MEPIDLVVPYVDSSDPEWQKLFEIYNPHLNEEGVDAPNRFRGQGEFFRFFFRCVEKNMPWIGKIHLLVQSESQVPAWIDRDKVHVVLHKEFIPEKFLPTFNSTAIEMFLWNIPGVNNRFIYTNDDVFAIGALNPMMFFKGVDEEYTRFYGVTRMDTMYGHHLDNTYKEIYGKIEEKSITVHHSFRPYFKSEMEKCYKEHKEAIDASISKFRQLNNLNVYLHDHYQCKRGLKVNKETFKCTTLSSSKPNVNLNGLAERFAVICLQDTGGDLIYENQKLFDWFKARFPQRSKYERVDVPAKLSEFQEEKINMLVEKLPEKMQEKARRAFYKSMSLYAP